MNAIVKVSILLIALQDDPLFLIKGTNGEKKFLDKECLKHNFRQDAPLKCGYTNYPKTGSFCLDVCASEGQTYGGPAGTDKCCCGSNLKEAKANQGCDSKCENEGDELCGIWDKAAIISTIKDEQNKLEHTGDKKYYGCYSKQKVENEKKSENPATFFYAPYPSFCIGYCQLASKTIKNIAYAGLHIDEQTKSHLCTCYKENQIVREGLCNMLSESECSEKCKGKEDQKCGGENGIELYRFADLENSPSCETSTSTTKETTVATPTTTGKRTTENPTTTETPQTTTSISTTGKTTSTTLKESTTESTTSTSNTTPVKSTTIETTPITTTSTSSITTTAIAGLFWIK